MSVSESNPSITQLLTDNNFFIRVLAETISFPYLVFVVINKIKDRNGLFNSSFLRAFKLMLNELKG